MKADEALLKGLKKRKTSATWIPWTAGRLSYRSGYGAGIASPGYYEHLWNSPGGNVASRWLSHVARLLRSEDLDDPVDLLFGVQLGRGTDINRALAYCQTLVPRPAETVLVLITDLYEGGNRDALLRRASDLTASGVNMICLLALSDDGAPAHDPQLAASLANIDVPAFACTPNLFPDLMAAAIQKQDLHLWAARTDLVTARGG